jgi:single-stranded DNA-specific DHH superfamily exonuclease
MVEFILGNKKLFEDFINNLDKEVDKIAIIADIDLDGISSAIFLEKILETKEIFPTLVEFSREKITKEKIEFLKERRINKIFILDIPIESTDMKGFNDLKENFSVFEIDHHPFEIDLSFEKNILKTNSHDCTGLTLFNLAVEYGLDEKEWAWLACAVAFSEFSYSNEENLKFIQKFYPDFVEGNFSTSIPGLNARKISSALVYHEKDIERVYELVKNKKIQELAEIQKIIEEEIDRKMETFFDNVEFFPDKKIYLYKLESPYNIKSYFTTMISSLKEDYTFIIYVIKGDKIHFSARNQSKEKDMNLLMRKAIEGLDSAEGGGHISAAGATIKKKDFEKFKNNLLNL